MFNLHLQNYYDHHLHAIYVLVLFDWCHFVWNFPYGFIVHIFVCVNGSTLMCWAKAIVSLTSSHSSPLGCLQFDCCVECISEKVFAWACEFSFPLCFLMSAHWAYISADEWLDQRGFESLPSWNPCLPRTGPTARICYLFTLLSLEVPPPFFVSHLWELGWTSFLLCSVYGGKRPDGVSFGPRTLPPLLFPPLSYDWQLVKA